MDAKKLETGVGPDDATGSARLRAIGLKCGVGIRASQARHGIVRISDFVNGMILAAILLEKNYPLGDRVSVADEMSRVLPKLLEVFSRGEGAADISEIVRPRVAEVMDAPNEALVTSGLSAEQTLARIGKEYGLARRDMIEVVAVSIAAALHGVRDVGMTSTEVEEAIHEIREKVALWDMLIPTDTEIEDQDDPEDEDPSGSREPM